jgi:hypothetical protein
MSNSNNIMTVEELQGYRSENLAWDLTLPEYVPSDRIAVNIGLLGRVAHLGGIQHVRVGFFDGDRNNSQPDIVNVGEDGSATAGMRTVKTKSNAIRTGINNGDVSSSYSEYWWADVNLDVNAVDLGDKVVAHNDQEGSMRDPKAWSHYLNKDLKKGLSTVTRNQLLDNVSGISKIIFGAAVLIIPFDASFSFSTEHLVLGTFTSFTSIQIGSAIVNNSRGFSFGERRRSLITGLSDG